MPYREVDLDKAARNVLTQEQFEQDGGDGTVASWRNTVTVENVHPNTTVSFRMNNLSGNTADLKLYAYGADGKLAEVSKELWTITDEAGTGVDTLADGTLYELRVSVADGGAFDLRRKRRSKFPLYLRSKTQGRLRCQKRRSLPQPVKKNTKSPRF